MKKEDKLITVCANCLCASCFQGIFYCDKYKKANIINMPESELRNLDREHPSYWIREEKHLENMKTLERHK